MAPNTLLNEDPFRNEHTQRLFEAIDELRSCGADTDIGPLPELVIVGDQSAGKSSLLQSLTDIPFPVASRLCTRFPTRIVSRRTPNDDEVIKISLETGPSGIFGAFAMEESTDEKAARLEAYRQFAYSSPRMTFNEFKNCVDRAQALMGIKHEETSENGMRTVGKRNFAEDILKVEVSGPEKSYFSILDVPGVFQSLTKDLKSDEKFGVRDMVARYMQPSQSIIICVASGTNDLANQAAFDMASTHDPLLKRTVGVITKCDISPDKEQLLSLAQNHEKALHHGWFVVRNRNDEELKHNITSEDHHDREKTFFDSAPWTNLPKSRRGVPALRKFLADLLCERIQDVFPTILATIKHRQVTTSSDLLALGPARKTTEEKRTYLTKFAQEFHDLTSKAISGDYEGLTNNTLKIRKHIREANDAFACQMRSEGHCVAFQVASIRLEDRKRGMSFEERNDVPDPQPPVTSKPSMFGGQPSMFGGQPSGGGLFGASPQTPKNSVGEQAPTTKGLRFQAPYMSSSSSPHCQEYFQHLCASNPYDRFSPEEIRLSDYIQGQSKPADRGTSGGFGGFGSSSSASNGHAQPNRLVFGHSPNNAANGASSSKPPATAMPAQQASQTLQINGATSPDERSSPIYTWIKEEVNNSRGTELQGTLNPDVLPALFHRQIAPWKDLATTHFSKTVKTVGTALKAAIETTCRGDATVAQRIQAEVRQGQETAEARGLSQIGQRIDKIASRHLQTQDLMFEEQIRKARLARFTAALKRYQSKTAESILPDGNATDDDGDDGSSDDDEGGNIVIDLRNAAALFDEIHMSNAQNLEDDIHDILKSYYELALRNFIDHVNQDVVESYVRDPEGPAIFFNPTYVSQLSKEKIEELGAEDADVVAKRQRLQETLERLNRAEKIALKYT
ncbi:MAG: hypothetical protein Q9226_006841 [Calogaya cf. arnoldii]